MCGILAVQCFNTPHKLNEILSASNALKVRGPDERRAIVKKSGIYIFHRRSINDLSSAGMQPFVYGRNEETLLMCNGQIYNSEELKKKHGIECASSSDCEVILHLYLKFGFEETVKMLDGVFAIVLVDKETMYVARDRIGVRPLFMGRTIPEKYVAFSSTPNVLQEFCDNIVPVQPNSILSFTKTPNGQTKMNVIRKGFEATASITTETFAMTEQQISQKLRTLLEKAVEKRLMSDRPIACFLSGGLDSSVVVKMMVDLMVKRGKTPKDVRTYSIGMEGSTDLFYAKMVADALGTTHTEVLFTEEEGLKAIPEVVRILGTYDITTIRASVGMYLLSKYISENTNDIVILSGEGSDELLFGYLYFHKAPSAQEAQIDSLRLISQLYLYDVLRGDRCVSSNGLELRVPFLDKDVVDFILSIPPEHKMPKNGYEKWILRKAFEGEDEKTSSLPQKVLWRQKTAFSDGVSAVKRSWYQCIQEYCNVKIPDEIYPHNGMFPSKEAFYYFLIFKKFYPAYEPFTPYWLPRWCGGIVEPSARALAVCTEQDV